MKQNIMQWKIKYNSMPVQARAGVWLVICNILVKGINFITIPLFTRLMTAAEYGNLTVYLSSTELVLILSAWDISYGAYQKGLYKYEDTRFYTKTVQFFYTAGAIAVILVLYGLQPLAGAWLAVPTELYPVMFLYLVTQPAYRNWMALKQKNYEYKKVTSVTLFYTITVTAVSLAAVIFMQQTAAFKYLVQMTVSFLVFLAFYIKNINVLPLLRKRQEFFEELKYIIQYQFPCLIHSMSLVILGQADRIMIKMYAGSTQAAIYGVAYSFSFLIIVIQSALDQALIPWRYELLGQKEYAKVNEISCILLVMIGGMTVIFILAAPEFMMLFFSQEYYESIELVPPIAASVYFIFLYSVFVSIEGYYENTKMLMHIAVLCSISNVAMNYAGIRMFGYKACAYTTLISYLMFCGGHYFAMNRICRKYMKKKVFNEKFILIFSAGMLVFAIGAGLIYKWMHIRYILLFLMILTGIAEKERIREILIVIRKERKF